MRKKHIPMRTCVGCRQSRPKRELIRVVRDPKGAVGLDLTGKKSGRGVYICPNSDCLQKAIKNRQLERNLETSVDQQVLDDLRRILDEQNL